MKITGIIAEYNPFHNGHAYQLKCAKEQTGADYLAAVMSGNFVQRGAPALLDKYVRTEMALFGGADLVLELPALWAAASAEYFAVAGVSLLEQLGCIDVLSCGCETPKEGMFSIICGQLGCESSEYRQQLTAFLKKGISYAKARELALLAQLPDMEPVAIREILGNPNNILALEYQKAVQKLHSAMRLHLVHRKGQAYHSVSMEQPMASAAAIRKFLQDAGRFWNVQERAKVMECMPPDAYRLLQQYSDVRPFLYEEDCSQMLHYCLLAHAKGGYGGFADCSADFSNKIRRHLNEYTDFTQFCALLKSKDIAYARIRRVLLHILLNIRGDDYAFWRSRAYVPYAKVLGFRREAGELLAHIKKHSAIPLLMCAADAKKICSKEPERGFFQKQAFADSLYRAMAVQKGGKPLPDEPRRQMVVI